MSYPTPLGSYLTPRWVNIVYIISLIVLAIKVGITSGLFFIVVGSWLIIQLWFNRKLDSGRFMRLVEIALSIFFVMFGIYKVIQP